MKTLLSFAALFAMVLAGPLQSQPSEPAEAVPDNPHLARSSWPLFHRNAYATASGDLPAPRPGDRVRVTRLDNPADGTSPWTVFPAPYADGSQAVISNTQHGVVKFLMQGPMFRQVSYLELPRGRWDFDWNVAALRNGEIVVTNISRNEFVLLRDARPDCPSCELVVARTITVPKSAGEITIHFSVSYDGHILVLMEDSRIAAISIATGQVVAVHPLGEGGAGYAYHNAFAHDETGRIFITTQKALTALRWDGRAFRTEWQAPYDFRGPGCSEPRRQSRLRERLKTIRGQRCTGTGTTPTLMGDAESGLVVMVDGHAPRNNLVAFWRGAIPAGWRGIPGQDRRLAGRIALPLSTPEGEGHTAENSPAVLGDAVFVAQWAGFNPDCTPPKGVQRVDWDWEARAFRLVWANPEAHFNGIPTVSSRTGLVYGTGRGEGCVHAYRGLDIATGRIMLDVPLGEGKEWTDQGNQQAIADDGSIVVGVRQGTMRLFADRSAAR
ncbi:hypothetical protein [Erythrobacter donghaensis]|uniref:hypothetical protein n=3 Tax=Erythrobacter donghaensis TaxID=267135 RepID=UPI000AE1C238|nr:hypothetical protein [Erythrobacter donghaensis]